MKTKAAAERLFPHHRLVRAFPVGLQLQLLQTIVLSISAHVMPLLTSMRCASESKITRLNQLRKRVARSILRLSGSVRHAYVMSEACLGDVTGEITMHRLRLLHALRNHPLRHEAQPPIACRVLDFMQAEATYWNLRCKKFSKLLAPWTVITEDITSKSVSQFSGDDNRLAPPEKWWENSPYASVVARLGERGRWIDQMKKGIDWACHSFDIRPPSSATQHMAALHFSTRLSNADAGRIAKLTPLSCLGPHGSSITALSRRHSALAFVLSSARRGNDAMQSFPFARPLPGLCKGNGARGAKSTRQYRAGAAAKSIVALAKNRRRTGKTCHLCTDSDDGPEFDIWHVLFECMSTRDKPEIVAIRDKCKAFLPELCDKIALAVQANAASMNNTQSAGVSHTAITAAIHAIRNEFNHYQWDCTPGKWLIYLTLLAMPFPARAVRSDSESPVWRRKISKGRKKGADLRNMPLIVPGHSDAEYRLPELVGQLFDVTILSRDALRPLANAWCSMSQDSLVRAGKTVHPLRVLAEARRAETARDLDSDDSSTASSSSSTMSSDSDSQP